MEDFKFIWTQEYFTTFQRNNLSSNGNQNLYLKPLKIIWDLYGDYDDRNIVIIDDLIQKHAYNGRGNCIITKTFSYDDANDNSLSDRLWPC